MIWWPGGIGSEPPLSATPLWRGGVAVRTWDSPSREPGFESPCCRLEALATSFALRRHSSLSCINEYLTADRGGYVNE